MRLDHIAYRCLDRDAAVLFFKQAFGYMEQAEFNIDLEDGSVAKCLALEPPEKRVGAPFRTMPGLLCATYFSPNSSEDKWMSVVDGAMAPRAPRGLGWAAASASWCWKWARKAWFYAKEALHLVSWRPIEYHMAPEIFVSEGPEGSLIHSWVKKNCPGLNGGIHHLAYEVEDVAATMAEWKAKGFLFTTEDVLECEDLKQCFTQPNPHTGVIYEFIERKGKNGFCQGNVARLMNSTAHLS